MIYPKIVRGGNAIPIGDNLFLMKGRKHKNGGIDIGKDLEVEGGEIMQTSPNEIKVFSAQKFLGGESPADLILSGANPDRVFAAQERYKDVNGINDDGTKKKAKGGSVVNWIKSVLGINSDNIKSPVKGNDNKNKTINFDNLKLTSGRAYNPKYLSEIYDGLTKRGISQNQAITVVGTIAEESGGDVFAKSDDKKYTGLLQWEDKRYKVKYPEDRDKELNSQLDYIADTLKNAQQRKDNGFYDDWTDGGEGSGYNSWEDAYKDFNDSTNVYNMTRGLNTGYVRPTGGIKGNTGSIKNRMNAAKQIFENNGITDLRYEPDKKQCGGINKKRNGGNIDNIDNDYFIAQTDYIENQKKWLNDWYDKRLKTIKKEHLKENVDKGLNTLYYIRNTENKDKRSYYKFNHENPNDSKIEFYNLYRDRIGAPLHEFTHATQYGGGNKYNKEFTNGKNVESNQSYYESPDEQHARIMELRFLNKLDPEKTNYTIDDLKQLKKGESEDLLNDLKHGGMNDEDIVNALNTFAFNNNVNNVNNNSTSKAKFGKQININMSKNENNAYLLGYSPSTGKQKKACGGRKKALMGSDGNEYTDITQMPAGVTPKLHDLDWSDQNAYKAPTYVVTPGLNSTNSNNNESNQDEEDILAGQKKLKTDYWLTTGLGALGKTAAGVTGAIINNATNRKYLGQMEGLVNKMKAYQIPLTKLKTNYNINPQLAEIENALRIGKNDIDANTASSQVALARKRAATLNATLEKNKLHGQKENIETDLINKDRLQQSQTIAENIRNTQNVENQKLQMLADIVDKRAENASATTQNIVGSVVGGIDTILNGANTYGQMLAGMAKSPDGANAIYGSIGKQQRERKVKKKNNDKNAG